MVVPGAGSCHHGAMPEYWGVALATFFETICPIDVAAMVEALTAAA